LENDYIRCLKMKKSFLMNFRSLYIVDTFIEVMYKRVKTGEWQTPEITPDELYALMQSNKTPILLYVLRMVGEDGLIPDIKLIHTRKLLGYLERLEPYKDKPFVIVCGGGTLAREYIKAVRTFQGNEALCDTFGIDLSRINSKLLISSFQDFAYPLVPKSIEELSPAILFSYSLFSFRYGRLAMAAGL